MRQRFGVFRTEVDLKLYTLLLEGEMCEEEHALEGFLFYYGVNFF